LHLLRFPEISGMAMSASEQTGKARPANPRKGDAGHDQDSDPPRTAVPPGSPQRPFQNPQSSDPTHDQDSDAPRTGVPPK
jgi:hypothetical protein